MSVLNLKSVLVSALLFAPVLMQPASAITCANCGDDAPRPPPQAPSCLAAGTKVTAHTGAQIAVEQIRTGTTLLALEQFNSRLVSSGSNPPTFAADVVTTVYNAPNSRQMYQLTDSRGHQLTATDQHPIFTVNRGHIQMARLRVGDVLLTTDGRSTVTGLNQVNYAGKVFNFVVNLGNNRGNQGRNASHTFFANGILVGDLRVQETLTARAR